MCSPGTMSMFMVLALATACMLFSAFIDDDRTSPTSSVCSGFNRSDANMFDASAMSFNGLLVPIERRSINTSFRLNSSLSAATSRFLS